MFSKSIIALVGFGPPIFPIRFTFFCFTPFIFTIGLLFYPEEGVPSTKLHGAPYPNSLLCHCSTFPPFRHRVYEFNSCLPKPRNLLQRLMNGKSRRCKSVGETGSLTGSSSVIWNPKEHPISELVTWANWRFEIVGTR